VRNGRKINISTGVPCVIVRAAALQCPYMGLGRGVGNGKGGRWWWWWTCHGVVRGTTSARQRDGRAAAGMSRHCWGGVVHCWGVVVEVVLSGLRWRASVGGRESGSGHAAAFWRRGGTAGVLLCWRSGGGKLVAERINMLLGGMCGKARGGEGHKDGGPSLPSINRGGDMDDGPTVLVLGMRVLIALKACNCHELGKNGCSCSFNGY
jgi:hypothetical protein